MTQEIIVFIILTAAVGYLGWMVYKRFFVKKSHGGCEGCVTGCAAKGKFTDMKPVC